MFGFGETQEYTVQQPFAWLKKVILILALLTFVFIIWYASSNRDQLQQENLHPQLVEAPKFPLKERPTAPGGMEVPHQDKEVFDLLAATSAPKKETKITFVPAQEPQKEIINKTAPQKIEAKTVAATPQVPVEAPSVKKVVKKVEKQASQVVAPVKKAVPTPTKQTAPKIKKKQTVVALAVKGWGVQLGSFKKQSDAANAIKIFNKKYSAILEGLTPTVREVTLKRGVFYRVSYIGLENKEAARNLCGAFKQRGQGCLHVNL